MDNRKEQKFAFIGRDGLLKSEECLEVAVVWALRRSPRSKGTIFYLDLGWSMAGMFPHLIEPHFS